MRIGAIAFAAVLAFPAGAAAMPFSYYREHKSWCDGLPQAQFATSPCVNRGWCDAHWNDDRITRMSCDPFRSKLDLSMPAIKVSTASLDAGRDLTKAETEASICLDEANGMDCRGPFKANFARRGGRMLPPGMKTARLALAARLWAWVFPDTVVKIGVGAGGKGVMSLTWNVNGGGPRRTETVHLSADEVDHLLAALNRSDFWRLPEKPQHLGVTDGEGAIVEVTMSGHRADVTDSVGPEDGVDLTVLVNEINRVIARHWKDVPG